MTITTQLPNMCGRCAQRWGGMNTAHCAACHRTFTGITAFDAHRRKGACESPIAVGLVENSRTYECFGYPSDPTREFPSA
jgi:hypothetical protein